MTPLVFALLLAQDPAIVEGKVLNALTNEPLKKAQVTLELFLGSEQIRYAVASDRDGKFRFEGIKPGDYQIDVERQGFLDDSDIDDFEVAEGEHVKDIVVKLTPQGVIDGHVVDDDGDPVPLIRVVAARTVHANGRAVVIGNHFAFTNNEGYFLLSELEAGRYVLSTELLRQRGTPPQAGGPGPEEHFVRNEDSVPRDVTAGAALRGVELHARKSSVYRIRGRISNPPKEGADIRLTAPDGVLHGDSEPYARLIDGAFEFADIAPGSYLLRIDSAGLYGRVPVTVSDRNLDGLTIELTTGLAIEGTIKMDGGGTFPKAPSIMLHGMRVSSEHDVTANEDGTFNFANLAPEKYLFDYAPPEGCYLKLIEFNHQRITSITVDLTSGTGGTLDVVVAPNAATLTGQVEGGKKADLALWNDSSFQFSGTESDGTFSFSHLAPGDYQVLAWRNVESQFAEIPEFRAGFVSQKITLAEGDRQSVTVKPIPKSAVDAEIAKLQ